MSKEKQKDSRIHEINLLSNGYVVVTDKQGKFMNDLSGAWSEKFEENLRAITPIGVKFESWGILPYAIDNIKKYGKPKC